MTGPIFTHPTQPEMQVEVILASRPSGTGPTLYTLRMRYPRIIHAELMTHRTFSRNARSSRAVPVKTMIDEVRTKPFVPWHWGKNQKGMQAGEDLGPVMRSRARTIWLIARNQATEQAEKLMLREVHKQLVNRLLEPFMWIDVLVTATEWANFLWLRNHKDAEPHLQDLAVLVQQALMAAEVQTLQRGQWHLPYITELDWHQIVMRDHSLHNPEVVRSGQVDGVEALRRISAARCARISYAPFDGDASYERELERYESLVGGERLHASPLEHQACPDDWHPGHQAWMNPHLHGNLVGWVQNRKLIEWTRSQDQSAIPTHVPLTGV